MTVLYIRRLDGNVYIVEVVGRKGYLVHVCMQASLDSIRLDSK